MTYNEDLKNALKIFSMDNEKMEKISLEMLKKEYYKKAKVCHPDKTHNNDNIEFREISIRINKHNT